MGVTAHEKHELGTALIRGIQYSAERTVASWEDLRFRALDIDWLATYGGLDS